jgi:tetratricopeptide (TPR) repeat protein
MKIKLLGFFLLCFFAANSQKTVADSLVKKAELKEKDKDYFYAIILLEKAIKANPEDPKLYYYKGKLEYKMKSYNESRKTLQIAISKFPTQSEPMKEMASFFEKTYALDSSLYYYGKAIKMAENDSLKYLYHSMRGYVYYLKIDYSKAKKDYEIAVENQPENAYAFNGLSLTYRRLKNYDQAIFYLKKMVKFDTTASSLMNLGLVYTEIDSLETAMKYFTEAVDKDPTMAYTYSNRGECYYKMGDYEKALKDINYSIKLFPQNPWVYKNKAKVFIAQGKFSDACIELTRAKDMGYGQMYGDEVNMLIKKNCK